MCVPKWPLTLTTAVKHKNDITYSIASAPIGTTKTYSGCLLSTHHIDNIPYHVT